MQNQYYIEIPNNQFLTSIANMPGQNPQFIYGRGRVGVYPQAPTNGKEVDRTDFFERLHELENQINEQLVGMDKITHVILSALVSGGNPFFVSLPGAAKTTIAKMVGTAVTGKYFRKNLTKSMSVSDLFGPLSVAGVQNGIWTREWSGLATATVALLDEFEKGSDTIQNNTLDIAEERTVTDSQGDRECPLLLLIGSGNGLANPTAANATWDRWLYRCHIEYPKRAAAIAKIATAASGTKPITVEILNEEIILIQAMIEFLAKRLPKDVIERHVKVILDLAKKNILVSPRRQIGWLRATVAEAMMQGASAITPDHLMIGEHILWCSPEDRSVVGSVIGGLTNPEKALIMAARAEIEKLENKLTAQGFSGQQELSLKIAELKKWESELQSKIKTSGLLSERDEMNAAITNLRADMMAAFADYAAPTN